MAIEIQVKESYRGPMDLLLYLIKRDEVDIHDIPISHVTKEYMAAIDNMSAIDVDLVSEFLELASILMEIKGKMLLPPEETDEDDDEIDIDPRSDLVKALLEYKKFKEAAGELDEMFDLHAMRLPRVPSENIIEEVDEDDMIDSNVYELYAAFARLMRETIASASATTIVATEVSTEECINNIEMKLELSGRVTFKELFKDAPTRPAMVAYFVAILELVRLRKIHAMQSDDFGEIYIEKSRPEDFEVITNDNESPLAESGTLGEYVKKVATLVEFPHIFCRSGFFAGKVSAFLPVKTRLKDTRKSCRLQDSMFKDTTLLNFKKLKPGRKSVKIFPEAASYRGIVTTTNNTKIIHLFDKEKTQTNDKKEKTVEQENKTFEKIVSHLPEKLLHIKSIKGFLDLISKSKITQKIKRTENIFNIFDTPSAYKSSGNKRKEGILSVFPPAISAIKGRLKNIGNIILREDITSEVEKKLNPGNTENTFEPEETQKNNDLIDMAIAAEELLLDMQIIKIRQISDRMFSEKSNKKQVKQNRTENRSIFLDITPKRNTASKKTQNKGIKFL